MRAVAVIPFHEASECAVNATPVAEHLRAGGLIAYPTETVYGFGCALQPAALSALARLKRREARKPFLLLVRDRRELQGLRWTPAATRLADAFWPGPLTLVLATGATGLPPEVTGPGGTVAVRASPHPGVRALLTALGAPITSTSANAPGAAPASSAAEVRRALDVLEAPDVWVLDGGALPPSAPSTIVDCSGFRPRVLRAGAIPTERLREIVTEIDEPS